MPESESSALYASLADSSSEPQAFSPTSTPRLTTTSLPSASTDLTSSISSLTPRTRGDFGEGTEPE